ncbi:uncharacterized protein LOC125054152 [Pieris napi]|uniref:uncharacterized protein LOC125054152 n=1 Tax=Pieris napi TaxID=78633 RepID=UPI001FBC0410|nr:uncharacterized protein LOC125054152 [Pieris napi]
MTQYKHVLMSTALWIFIVMEVSCGINLGLISGDRRRLTSPFLITKTSRHSPITININSKSLTPNLSKSLLSRNLKPKLNIPKIPLMPIFPILPPVIPKLPILPPLLPIIPPLPILPLPIIPLLPKTLKAPKLLRKTALQRDLERKIKTAMKPPPKISKNIAKFLLNLKKKGSITTAEYLRFKKLLI